MATPSVLRYDASTLPPRTPSPEANELNARLVRIKKLIEILDTVASRTIEQEQAFVKLKHEMKALRESLRIVNS